MVPSPRRPLIRSTQVRANLEATASLGAAGQAAVRAALDPDHLARIEDPAAPVWLPLDFDRRLFAAIHEVAGTQGVRRCGRDAMLEMAGLPSFRPLMRATVRVFGLTPASLLRIAPKAWKHVIRHAGDLEVIDHPGGHPQLRYVGAPPDLLDDRVYLDSVAASFEAAIWYAGLEGDVTWTRQGDHIDFTTTWTAAPSSPGSRSG